MTPDLSCYTHGSSYRILGDRGAVSRVDQVSVVKVYCKIETSPWELTLTEPVPEAFDWPEHFLFWPISEEEQARETFTVKRVTQLWRSMRKSTTCKKTSESSGCSSWPEKFCSAQLDAGNSNASGTGSVRVNSQGLFSILQ